MYIFLISPLSVTTMYGDNRKIQIDIFVFHVICLKYKVDEQAYFTKMLICTIYLVILPLQQVNVCDVGQTLGHHLALSGLPLLGISGPLTGLQALLPSVLLQLAVTEDVFLLCVCH